MNLGTDFTDGAKEKNLGMYWNTHWTTWFIRITLIKFAKEIRQF